MKAAARAAEQAAEKIEKSGKKSSSSLGRMLLDAKNHEQAWQDTGTTMLGFGATLTGMVALSVTKYAQFDKAMSRVKAATHASRGEMNLLREAAISAGADTAFSAEEAAGAIEELAKAGVSTEDILSGGLTGALSLAAAGELQVGKAAEIAATAMTQFKLKGDQIPHVADLLAAGAGKAQGSVEDLGMALKQSGLVASATGLSLEETTGTLAAFASNGLIGSDAGTSFKTMLQALQNPSDRSAATMEKLGISLYDAKGQFAGMRNLADQLAQGMSNLTQEQRDQAMAQIFGSDAVRAANVLYKEGAAGIRDWTEKVNAAGYAAQTAMIMQDNLVGDLEKLGGSFDTLLIKSGGGVNDVIRSLVQDVEGLVDGLGKIDPVALSTIASIAGIVGVTALAGGAFMKLVPAAISSVTAFQSLGKEGGKIPGVMGKVTKAALIAGAALAALQIVGELISTEHVKSTTDYAEAVMKVSQAGEAARASDLTSVFQGWDTVFGTDRTQGVASLGQAVAELANPSFSEGVDKNFNSLNAFFNLPSDKLTLIEERFEGLSDTLGELASTGDGESAARTFRLISEEFQRNGKSAQDALNVMPGYSDALRQMALDAGVQVNEQELLNWALSGMAPAAVTAAQGAGALRDELADVGLSAAGVVVELDKLLESMFAAGLATMSSRDAAFAWKNTLRDSEGEIKKILSSQGKLGKALNGSATDFNTNTDSGEAANKMFQEMAQQGLKTAEIYSKDVSKSQEDVQKQLSATYDGLVTTAKGFGMGDEAAASLAREVLQVPKGVSIDTWISDSAEQGAKAAKDAVNGIPDWKGVKVIVTDEGTVTLTDGQIQSIKDRTISTTVTDDGTIMRVQGGINNIDGTEEFILVGDDGTIQVVQSRINGVNGKPEYIRVTDGGTVQGVQGAINSIKGKEVTITATYQTHGVPFKAALSALPAGVPGHSEGGWTGPGGKYEPVGIVHGDEFVVQKSSRMRIERTQPGLLDYMNRYGEVPNLGGYAKGGKVAKAEQRVASTKRAYEKIDGKSENRTRKLAAKDQYEAAKKELAQIKKETKEEKEKAARVREARFDLRRETKRGDITEAFTSGGGMGYVDKMFELSYNKDISKKQREKIRALAYDTEAALLKLEKVAERNKAAFDRATEARDKLLTVRDSVSSALSGGTSIEGMLTKHYEYSTAPATAKSLAASAKADAAKIKAFGKKLDALVKMGYPPAVIQEVAELGTLKGSAAADVLLAGSASDVETFKKAYKDIQKYSDQAGQYVTESLAKGGLNAAETLVKNLATQEDAVEKAFYKLGKAGQKGFHKAWGIASPSKEAAKDVGWITKGILGQVDKDKPQITKAMEGLYASPSYGTVAYAPATAARQAPPVVQVTAVVTNPFTSEQVAQHVTDVAVKEVPAAIGANYRNNSHGGVWKGKY